jgi:hypothetical protein
LNQEAIQDQPSSTQKDHDELPLPHFSPHLRGGNIAPMEFLRRNYQSNAVAAGIFDQWSGMEPG